jgi:hypothetical protein
MILDFEGDVRLGGRVNRVHSHHRGVLDSFETLLCPGKKVP